MSDSFPTFKIAALGDETSLERGLPLAVGAIARAAKAAKESLAKFGLEEIEIWPPGQYPLLGLEAASLASSALAAVEPPELRRCPIVRKILDNAIAYAAHVHWVNELRREQRQKWRERQALSPLVSPSLSNRRTAA